MTIAAHYRHLKDQWPETARWAVPVWVSCFVLVGLAARGIYQNQVQQRPVSAPAAAPLRPIWQDQALAVAKIFPANPALWRQAAGLLKAIDPAASLKLATLAERVEPGAASATMSGTPDQPSFVAAMGSAKVEADVAQACLSRPKLAADFVGCLMIQGRWADALNWTSHLSPSSSTSSSMRDLKAEVLCRLGDWDGIRAQLAGGAWGSADPAAVNLAISACIAAQRGQTSLRRELWKGALERCGASVSACQVVLRLALAFDLKEEAAQSFHAVLSLEPRNRTVAEQFEIWTQLHSLDRSPTNLSA